MAETIIPLFGTLKSAVGSPVTDDTEIKGGIHIVTSQAELDNMPDDLKKTGMIAVINTPDPVSKKFPVKQLQADDSWDDFIVSPYIGQNGNWFINGVDSGISASGGSGAVPSAITNLATDIQNLANDQLVQKKNNKIASSGIAISDTEVDFGDKSVRAGNIDVDSTTINIGDAVSLKESGGFLEKHTNTLGKDYLFVTYENDPIKGTKKADVSTRGPKQTGLLQSDNSQTTGPITFYNVGFPKDNRQLQSIYYDFVAPVKNFRMQVTVNGNPIGHYPSKRAWEGSKPGLDLDAGVQKIDFDPFFSYLTDYNILVNFKSDDNDEVNLRCDSNKTPWRKVDYNIITNKYIALEEDLNKMNDLYGYSKINFTNTNNSTIKGDSFAVLQSTKDGFKVTPVGNMFSYNGQLLGYIRDDIVSGDSGIIELVTTVDTEMSGPVKGQKSYLEFSNKQFKIVPISQTQAGQQDIIGQIGEFGDVNDNGKFTSTYNAFLLQSAYYIKKIYTQSSGGDAPFREAFSLKAINKTGTTISGNRFVMIAPDDLWGFYMTPITKSVGYKGEMIGYIKSPVDNGDEGVVELITTMATGVTTASEGETAYIGFSSDDQYDNSISIEERDNLTSIFGRCGVFGKKNSVGEFMATFNTFSVQSDYLDLSRNDNIIDYHETLPASINKDALFIYLTSDITDPSGTIEQPIPKISDLKNGTQLFISNRSTSSGATIRIRSGGNDTIEGSPIFDVSGGEKVFLVATPNGWVNYTTSTSGGAVDQQQVQKNTADIGKLRAEFDEENKVYTYYANIPPIYPSDARHGYYLTFYDLNNDIEIPLPDADGILNGTVLLIDNQDPTSTVKIKSPSDAVTIGMSTELDIPKENVAYLVKRSDYEWLVAFNGFIPPSMDELMSTIETGSSAVAQDISIMKEDIRLSEDIYVFDGDGMPSMPLVPKGGYYVTVYDTNKMQIGIPDIQGIKDGTVFLFNNKGEIDPVTIATVFDWTIDGEKSVKIPVQSYKKFIKKGDKKWVTVSSGTLYDAESGTIGLKDTSDVPSEDEKWGMKKFNANENVLINTQYKGSQYLMFTLPATTSTMVKSVEINGSAVDFNDYDFYKDKLLYKIFISDMPVSTNQDINFKINFGETGSAQKGKLQWYNMEGNLEASASEVQVMEPLVVSEDVTFQSDTDQRVKLELRHSYFELYKPPEYLAYAKEETPISGISDGITSKAKIYFDTIIEAAERDFPVDMATKSIGLQDYKSDDPSVTGGSPVLCIARLSLKGTAPKDGKLKLSLIAAKGNTPVQDGSILQDADGNYMEFIRDYAKGEEFGVIQLTGIYMAKELVQVQIIVEHEFYSDSIVMKDKDEGISGVLFKALDRKYQTGVGLLQFEMDTKQDIRFDSHWVGDDIFNWQYKLQESYPERVMDIGDGETSVDGSHFYNATQLKGSLLKGVFHIEDNGTDPMFFNFGQILNYEKTFLLRDRQIDVNLGFKYVTTDFRLGMAIWTGDPDKYTNKIMTGLNQDGSPIMEPNWELVSSEVYATVAPEMTETMIVPSNANNFAILVYPAESKLGLSVDVYKFFANAKEKSEKWIVWDSINYKESQLLEAEQFAIFKTLIPKGVSSYSYAVNSDPTRLPVGVLKIGKAGVKNDNSWYDTGSLDPNKTQGDLEFLEDATAVISTEIFVQVGSKITDKSTNEFYWAKKQQDGSFLKIDDSSTLNFDLPAGGSFVDKKLPTFSVKVKKGDSLRFFGVSSEDDGAFIKSNVPKYPLTKITVELKDRVVREDVFTLSSW